MVDDTKKTASGNDFLVFINFSKASYNALDYTIKLVKAVGGSIEVHYIINPEEIADSENHFVAVRSINELRYKARKKLNWKPKINLNTLIREMINSEYDLINAIK